MALIAAHLNAEVILAFATPHTPFSPSLISLVISVDVKHHVYFTVTAPRQAVDQRLLDHNHLHNKVYFVHSRVKVLRNAISIYLASQYRAQSKSAV